MTPSLKEFLDRERVRYVTIEHSPAFTMQEVAASTHVPGHEMAKTIVVELDGEMALAVLPATQKVVIQDLRELTGSENAKFAVEMDFNRMFADCELGAMPPFGNLYGMDTFVAESFTHNDDIAFNAGSHTEIVRMAYADFERLVQPKVLNFTV